MASARLTPEEDSSVIRLDIMGQPYPQGSKSAFIRGGKPVVVDGTSPKGRAGHTAWRQAVATAVRDYLTVHPREVISEPCTVIMDFRFALPGSDPYRSLCSVKPDWDKLARSVCDSLVDGGLLRDDSLIWKGIVTKQYAHGKPPGCTITVFPDGLIEADRREELKHQAKVRRTADKTKGREK